MYKTFYIQTPPEELIFGLALVTVAGLIQLPYETINGNPIPTIFFKNQPFTFHAFLLALNFAFTGAVITLSFREEYPKIAGYCRCFAVVSMSMVAGILAWVMIPTIVGLLDSLFIS